MQSNVCANEVGSRQMKFFSDRLAHRVPLEVMFWRDMIMAGTAINLVFLAASLALAAFDWPTWLALLVLFAPIPYNAFIWHCVWTAAAPLDINARLFVRTVASAWLTLVILL